MTGGAEQTSQTHQYAVPTGFDITVRAFRTRHSTRVQLPDEETHILIYRRPPCLFPRRRTPVHHRQPRDAYSLLAHSPGVLSDLLLYEAAKLGMPSACDQARTVVDRQSVAQISGLPSLLLRCEPSYPKILTAPVCNALGGRRRLASSSRYPWTSMSPFGKRSRPRGRPQVR